MSDWINIFWYIFEYQWYFHYFQNNWGIYTYMYSMNVHTSYAIWGECLTILIRMSVHWRTTGAWGWDWDRMCRNRGRRFILITRAWNHQNNSMSRAVFDMSDIQCIHIKFYSFEAFKFPKVSVYSEMWIFNNLDNILSRWNMNNSYRK